MSGATGTTDRAGADARILRDGAGAAEYWTLSGTVAGPLPKAETEAVVEREQAAVADPVPLGLAGFASATFTISAVFAGWFAMTDVVLAIPVALVFGGIVQFLAGMWAFRRGNALAATAFGAFGAFNASWAILEWLTLSKVLPSSAGGGNPGYVTGIFILTFALIALYLGVAATGQNLTIAAILFVLALTYLCDGIGVMIGGQNVLMYIGGYAGLVTSIMAFYLSGAIVINSAFKREVLPVFAAAQSH
ncbi:MAG TPA: acetate uptake transporter [Ktedonobacterales bacterium]|nr:acetate uptake transporter [Ktedonobacterales bacterium]